MPRVVWVVLLPYVHRCAHTDDTSSLFPRASEEPWPRLASVHLRACVHILRRTWLPVRVRLHTWDIYSPSKLEHQRGCIHILCTIPRLPAVPNYTSDSSYNNNNKKDIYSFNDYNNSMHISIFAVNNTFVAPIVNLLIDEGHEVHLFTKTDVEAFNQAQISRLLDHTEVAFFDFCHYPLSYASNMPFTMCRIVARLHGIEVYTSDMKIVNWPKVHVIMTRPQELRFTQHVTRDPSYSHATKPARTLLNIGVDVEGLEAVYRKRTRKNKKFGHNIALIATSALPRKGIIETIESFGDLRRRSDKPWHLHIRTGITGWRREAQVEYMTFIKEFLSASGLAPHITIHPKLPIEEFREWLSTMDILISNSHQEGYHKAVGEAMASGIMPFIRKWYGADLVWNPLHIFTDQRDLVDRIIEWEALDSGAKKSLLAFNRDQAVQFHDEKVIARRIVDIIENKHPPKLGNPAVV